MALCDLSNRNPNVLYELGLRQAYDKPVVLIQDEKTEKIFDVSGISTVFYKSTRLYENVLEARKEITEAIIATKEGNESSVVKVINARKATISTDDLTQTDKIQIMLNAILENLNESKENRGIIINDSNSPVNFFLDEYRSITAEIIKLNSLIERLSHAYSGTGVRLSSDSAEAIYRNLGSLKVRVKNASMNESRKQELFHKISNTKERLKKIVM